MDTMPLNVEKVKLGGGTSATDGVVREDAFAGWILSPPYRGETRQAGTIGILPPGAPHGNTMPSSEPSTRTGLQGVLFDLDGVLVDTARFHFLAWKKLAEELGVEFDERINHSFRGVGRMECLDMLLGEHGRFFAIEEKSLLADRKNGYYLELVKGLSPKDLVEGARELARELHAGGVRLGLVSASCNARLVLRLMGITAWFDAIVDGTECREKRDGFLRAAEKMRVNAEQCVVVEDAEAGVNGAKAAGMKVIGIGESAVGADVSVGALSQIEMGMVEGMAAAKSE